MRLLRRSARPAAEPQAPHASSRRSSRLLLAFSILLLAGALQLLEFWKFPGGLVRTAAGDAPVLLHTTGQGGRYAMQRNVAGVAEGADVLLDRTARGYQMTPLHLRAMLRASSVTVVDLGGAPEFHGSVTAKGSWRGGWRLVLAATATENGDPVERLVLFRSDGVLYAVDASLISSELPHVEAQEPGTALWTRLPAPAHSLPLAVLLETTAFLWLTLLGGLLLSRRGVHRALRPPLALLVGVAIVAGIGIFGAPGWLTPAIATGLAVAGGLLLRRRGSVTGWRRTDLPMLGLATACAAAASSLVRSRGLVVTTPDSFDYWSTAYALASGELGSADLDVKRPPGQAALHAVGFLLGIEGLLSLGLVVLLACAALLVLIPAALGRRDVLAFVVAASMGLVAISSAQLLTLAYYINSHILVAGMMFLVAFLGLLQQRTRLDESTIAIPASLGLVALIMFRAEAPLLIGILLLGTLLIPRDADATSMMRVPWAWAWLTAGSASLLWGVLAMLAVGRTTPSLVFIAAGTMFLMAPLVLSRMDAATRDTLPTMLMLALWVFMLTLLVTESANDVRFLEPTRINLWEGRGGWGLTAPLLLALGIGSALAATDRTASIARWAVIGFVPATFVSKLADGTQSGEGLSVLTSALLSGGARVGWGDSVNRMWAHIALVVLLLALVALLDGSGARWTAPRAVAVGLVLMLGATEFNRWEPQVAPEPSSDVLWAAAPAQPEPLTAPSAVGVQAQTLARQQSVSEEPRSALPAIHTLAMAPGWTLTLSAAASVDAEPSAARVAAWRAARSLVRNGPVPVAILLALVLLLPGTSSGRPRRSEAGQASPPDLPG